MRSSQTKPLEKKYACLHAAANLLNKKNIAPAILKILNDENITTIYLIKNASPHPKLNIEKLKNIFEEKFEVHIVTLSEMKSIINNDIVYINIQPSDKTANFPNSKYDSETFSGSGEDFPSCSSYSSLLNDETDPIGVVLTDEIEKLNKKIKPSRNQNSQSEAEFEETDNETGITDKKKKLDSLADAWIGEQVSKNKLKTISEKMEVIREIDATIHLKKVHKLSSSEKNKVKINSMRQIAEYAGERETAKNGCFTSEYKTCFAAMFKGKFASKSVKIDTVYKLTLILCNDDEDEKKKIINTLTTDHLNALNDGNLKVLWKNIKKDFPEVKARLKTIKESTKKNCAKLCALGRP